ncbi:hypothetical protein ABZV92_18570 [Streptomyces rubiginosohelvolus]|uniref:hypothetical protein n=1 Tax=Streptomyces rubiginosohelvolus TaxID=67362 RepID=UPI0033A43890
MVQLGLIVTAFWVVGLGFLAVADHYADSYNGPLGVAVRLLLVEGGALTLVAAKFGTWALVLTTPLWITTAVLQYRRRWNTAALVGGDRG